MFGESWQTEKTQTADVRRIGAISFFLGWLVPACCLGVWKSCQLVCAAFVAVLKLLSCLLLVFVGVAHGCLILYFGLLTLMGSVGLQMFHLLLQQCSYLAVAHGWVSIAWLSAADGHDPLLNQSEFPPSPHRYKKCLALSSAALLSSPQAASASSEWFSEVSGNLGRLQLLLSSSLQHVASSTLFLGSFQLSEHLVLPAPE